MSSKNDSKWNRRLHKPQSIEDSPEKYLLQNSGMMVYAVRLNQKSTACVFLAKL